MKAFRWMKKNNSSFETIEYDIGGENVNFLDNPFVKIKRSIFRKSSTNSESRISNQSNQSNQNNSK